MYKVYQIRSSEGLLQSNQTLNMDVDDFNLSLHERLPVLGQ